MEPFTCSVSQCQSIGLYLCDHPDHNELKFCHLHSKLHYSSCQNQGSFPYKKQIRSIDNLNNLPLYLQDNIKIASFHKNLIFMSIKIKIIQISEAIVKVFHLNPSRTSTIEKHEDLEHVFMRKSEKLANSITTLSSQDDKKIEYLCKKFMKSLKKIILNLHCEIDALITQITKSFKNYHSAVETARMELLNIFLSKAETRLKFPKEGRKNLFFTVKIDEEKIKFLSEYMFRDIVRINDFVINFNDFFKPFLGPKRENIEYLFKELNSGLMKIKAERKEIFDKEVNDLLQVVWRNTVYQQCDVIMSEVPGKDQAMNIADDWKIVFSFVQVDCPMTMHSVTELSDNDLIIVLCRGSLHYIIYYNGQQGMILTIFKADILQIASGSTLDNIVIWQYPQNSCYLYGLENAKLIEKNNIDLGLINREIISYLVFTPELGKLVYVVNGNQFKSVVFKQLRANITFNLNDELCTDMKYSHDSRLIIIKTENNIKILNDYFIIVNESKLLGDKIVVYKKKEATRVFSKYKSSLIIIKVKDLV